MENIAPKIKTLNYSENVYPMINKFLGSLSDNVISLEEVVQIVNYLTEKGIVIAKPSQQKVLASGFEFIKSQVEKMESIGELDAYIEDPVRINCKSAYERLLYLKKIEQPYKNEDNKYSRILFSKKAFESKYGVIDFQEELGLEVKEEVEPISIPDATEMVAPVVESKEEVADVDKQREELEKTMALELSDVANLVNGHSEIDMATEGTMIEPSGDPIDEILAKPQTISFNDETFDRYERLSDSIRHILMEVYGAEEVNENITDNLIKLITNEVADDSLVMFKAITFNKTISEQEAARLKEAITEELEYTSILDIDLGRAA